MTPDPQPSVLPLAVVVLTRNEERHLPDCLASVAGIAERVLVLDSGSTDRTVEIAREAGADVAVRQFTGYASQRETALGMVSQPWVLFLDADERLTPALRHELARVLTGPDAAVAGYWIPRRNWICGREMRGGGWSPDHQLRLLRRGHARYRAGQEVHEIVDLDGPAAYLHEPLLHHNYDTLAEFRQKQATYARMRVDQLRRQGVRPRRRTYFGQPAREFWRRYVRLGGFRDGWFGLLLATMMAWYELCTWLALRDQRGARARPGRVGLPAAATDLSVIIVNYNVRELLLDCLASIEASLDKHPLGTEVIVVDNGSSDGSAQIIRRRFPWVRVIENGFNAGFAAANNVGIRQSQGRVVVLLNPDTRVIGDALGALVRYLDGQPDVGVVGPRIYRPDGTTQSTRRRFPTLLTGLLESTIVQDYVKDNRVLRRYYLADRSDDELQDVDWLVGACLAVRREAIETAGLLDERFFMYSEEVEWCHRIRSAGWRVVYYPGAAVVHHEGASSRQDAPARQIAFDTSKVLLFEMLYGRGTARVLRTFLLSSYLFRVVVEGAKGLLGHKRSLRRRRVSLYLSAFRSGLRPRSRTS